MDWNGTISSVTLIFPNCDAVTRISTWFLVVLQGIPTFCPLVNGGFMTQYALLHPVP